MEATSVTEQLRALRDANIGGKPAISIYWLLRKHGESVTGWRLGGGALRSIAKTLQPEFPIHFTSLNRALKLLETEKIYELVSRADWPGLEELLFSARYPHYKSLTFYKLYVAPGDKGYEKFRADLKARTKAKKKHSAKAKAPPQGGGEPSAAPAPTPSSTPSTPAPDASDTSVEADSATPKTPTAAAFLKSAERSRERRESVESPHGGGRSP